MTSISCALTPGPSLLVAACRTVAMICARSQRYRDGNRPLTTAVFGVAPDLALGYLAQSPHRLENGQPGERKVDTVSRL